MSDSDDNLFVGALAPPPEPPKRKGKGKATATTKVAQKKAKLNSEEAEAAAANAGGGGDDDDDDMFAPAEVGSAPPSRDKTTDAGKAQAEVVEVPEGKTLAYGLGQKNSVVGTRRWP